jgi:hypothetical protein
LLDGFLDFHWISFLRPHHRIDDPRYGIEKTGAPPSVWGMQTHDSTALVIGQLFRHEPFAYRELHPPLVVERIKVLASHFNHIFIPLALALITNRLIHL